MGFFLHTQKKDEKEFKKKKIRRCICVPSKKFTEEILNIKIMQIFYVLHEVKENPFSLKQKNFFAA